MNTENAEEKRIFDTQFELLKKELDLVDAAIRQHDEITKSIKNWAIVTWTASIGIFLSNGLREFILITAIVPMVFWLVDASFRKIQRSFISRANDISTFINSETFLQAASSGEGFEFELLKMRSGEMHWKNSLLGVMLFYSVSLLYLGLILGSIIVSNLMIS